MKNYEKYAEEIKDYRGGIRFCGDFIEPIVLNSCGFTCEDIECHRCLMLQMMWMLEDYEEPKEPEVDWSKVEVDTPILVRHDKADEWEKAYFAKYEDNMVRCWMGGRTSWNEILTIPCTYAKLAETEGAE